MLARLTDRLAQQFPELSREVVAGTVRAAYRDFTQSRVREFLPILVERRARAALRSG